MVPRDHERLISVWTRVASFMFVIFLLDTFAIIGASLALYGKLRRMNDIYSMSLEIQLVGAFALLSLGK